MNRLPKVSIAIVVVIFVVCSSKQVTGAPDNTSTARQQGEVATDNEIEDDQRIELVEPYKSMIQTTARFAIAQTRIPTVIHMETLMKILGEVAYHLAKPVVLFKVVKLVGILVATVTAATFAFPSSYAFVDSFYKDPINTLNLDRYFSNGVSERSVLSIIESRTGEALNRVGLQDSSCRERSLCYAGEILRCTFPATSQSVARTMSGSFSDSGIKDNVYYKAFTSGFVDRNCTNVGLDSNSRDNGNCLASIVNSLVR